MKNNIILFLTIIAVMPTMIHSSQLDDLKHFKTIVTRKIIALKKNNDLQTAAKNLQDYRATLYDEIYCSLINDINYTQAHRDILANSIILFTPPTKANLQQVRLPKMLPTNPYKPLIELLPTWDDTTKEELPSWLNSTENPFRPEPTISIPARAHTRSRTSRARITNPLAGPVISSSDDDEQ